MASDYERLFGLPSLAGKVEAFRSNVLRPSVYLDKFQQGRNISSLDGTVKWDELVFSQGLAPVAGRQGRHKRKNPLTKIARSSACASIKRSVVLDASRLFFEREAGTLAPNAEAYVEQEMHDLMGEILATLTYMSAESLRGTLTVNDTNIPGSEQAFAIAYSPNTYAKSAAWSTAGTGILSSEVPAMKISHRQSSGLEAAQAIAGNAFEGYFGANTEISNFASSQMGQRMIEASGQMEGAASLRVGNIDWHLTEGGYIPEGGSFTRYLPTVDQAIVLPADAELGNVLGMARGRGLVPAQSLGAASAAASLIRPAAEEGFYAYAALIPGTPAIELFVGFEGMPIVLRPDAVTVVDAV